jgi:hypothetical protein
MRGSYQNENKCQYVEYKMKLVLRNIMWDAMLSEWKERLQSSGMWCSVVWYTGTYLRSHDLEINYVTMLRSYMFLSKPHIVTKYNLIFVLCYDQFKHSIPVLGNNVVYSLFHYILHMVDTWTSVGCSKNKSSLFFPRSVFLHLCPTQPAVKSHQLRNITLYYVLLKYSVNKYKTTQEKSKFYCRSNKIFILRFSNTQWTLFSSNVCVQKIVIKLWSQNCICL